MPEDLLVETRARRPCQTQETSFRSVWGLPPLREEGYPAAMEGPTLLVDTSFLGDVVCAEPMIGAVVERYGRPVDFLTSPGPAALLEGHPHLRETLVFEKRGSDRGISGLLRAARRLRERHYARAICSHRSWRSALLLRLARIPIRIGFDNAAGSRLFTDRVAYREELHEIERNLALVGIEGWRRPRLYPSPDARAKAAELAPPGRFIALAPGSIWATKRWTEAGFREVARTLVREGTPTVLLGGPEDGELCERIANASGAVSLAGKTDLLGSLAVLERAAAVVTNDSAPLHLGVAADIPVVALFCSTSPSFGFAPRGENDIVVEVGGLDCRPCGIHGHNRCPERHFRCAEEIAAEHVLEAVRRVAGG